MILTIDEQLQNLMVDCVDNGQKRETRSGLVRGVFRREIVWDMRHSLPFPMTKELYLPGVISELLMFISGKSDRRVMQKFLHGNFEKDRWDIWKPDCERKAASNPDRFNGYNLGEMYPTYWRQLMVEPHGVIAVDTPKDLDSEYVPLGTPTVAKVGINDKPGCQKSHPRIYMLWRDMLVRCYGNKPRHQSWRHRGVTVSPRWLQLSNFFDDVFCLPGFQKWVSNPGEYSLDKDYFGSKVYSKYTCIFLRNDINASLSSNTRIFRVGDVTLFGTTALAEHFGVARNGRTWRELVSDYGEVEFIGTVGDTNLRPRIFVDQLQNVVDQMKNAKVSRYMLVDSWNPNHATEAVLGACHNNFQVYVDVETGEFDLNWSQRSVDSFLGLPYNIASYSILMLILGKLTGLTPRFLYGDLKDTHIYEAHLEAIETQLDREARFCTAFIEMPEFSSLDDLKNLTAEDFVLVDYEPDPAIRAPLLVG